MLVIVTFTVNAVLNFLLGLVVAGALGPEQYGQFSVASMAAIVFSTIVFDWLRLSTTRFYCEATRAGQPRVRASLNAGYLAGAVALMLVGVIIVALRLDLGLAPAIVVAVPLVAAANGLFEFFGAMLRARFRNNEYGVLIIAKNVLAFVTMFAVGQAFHSAALVLLMLALSSLSAVLALRKVVSDPCASVRSASCEQLASFACYGLPIVLANILYQAIVLINRSQAAAQFGYADAGQLSLATDLTIRMMLSVGAALDVFLFQVAVHSKASAGEEGARRQIARNMIVVLAVLLLLCIGYIVAAPAFAAVVVPEKFRSDFESLSVILAPGVLLFCLGQFALSPVTQLFGKTSNLIISAAVSFALDITLLWLIPASYGLRGYAFVHSISLTAGFLVMLWQTARLRESFPCARDLCAVAVAAIVATAAMSPFRNIEPAWFALFCITGVGIVVYAGVLVNFNVGGLSHPIIGRLNRIPAILFRRGQRTLGRRL
jgi:O-antigen/teichoic acid export membrane protein